MDRAQLGEHLLSVVCGRKRASEIVGDLLEQVSADHRWFWWSIFQTLAHFTWRSAVAILVAASSIFFGLSIYIVRFETPAGNTIDILWGLKCCLIGACVWSVVVLNVFRYGVRSRLNGIGLGLVTLLGGLAFLKSSTSLIHFAIATAIAYAAICLGTRSLRAPFCSLLAAAASYAGTFYLLMHLIVTSSQSPLFIGTQFFGYWLLSFMVEAAVLGYTCRRFTRPALDS